MKVNISEKQLVIDGLLPRRYSWEELEAVMIKDNILTLDFRDNRLLQREIDPSKNRVDELVFNTFCEQLVERERGVEETRSPIVQETGSPRVQE